jgi:acetyl-CoA synthetase (ADP-forming)
MTNVSSIIDGALKEGRNALLEYEANAVCASYGVPVAKVKLAVTSSEAVKNADEIGYPVVLKIVSPDILHKSDAGGVIVNVKSADEVKEGFTKIVNNAKNYKADANVLGVLVQEMAPSSTEVIVGMTKDPTWGPALMFGLGGIFVEVLKDVSFRVAPITERDANEMVREIKAFKILEGIRGQPPADIDAIVDILLKISKLVMENPMIDEIDLNPVFVYEDGAKAVDTRILIKE